MNEIRKRKRGEIREDGWKFWSYQKNWEYWLPPEKFQKQLEKTRIAGRKYEKAHPEKRRVKNQKWRDANPEKRKANFKAWREANREHNRTRLNVWLQNNPDFTRARNANQRARKRLAIPADTWPKAVRGVFEIAHRVSKCLQIPHQVDHVVPLACGGSHCHRNLQVIPETWNMRKQDRPDFRLPDCYRTDGYFLSPI